MRPAKSSAGEGFCPLRRCLRSGLFPPEGDHAVNIDEDDRGRDEIAEDGLHPGLDLPALARVGLGEEIVPAPAEFIAAVEREDERAERQDVVGDEEVPEIEPCAAVRKRLELEHAVAQRRGQGKHEHARTADQTAKRPLPAGHFAHHGENVLADSQNRGHGGEDHEQEEQRAPPAAARHVVEDGSHGVEQQARASVDLQPVGIAGREHNEARDDGDKRIEHDDVRRFAEQRLLFSDIAAEDRHGSHADGQREERLIHRADDDRAGDLGEIGDEIEFQTLCRAGERCAVDRQHDHQHHQKRHHILRDALQTALEIKAQNAEGHNDRHGQIRHVDAGVCDHGDEAEIFRPAGQESDEVIDDPAGDDGIERHERDVAEESDIAVEVPLLTLAFKLLIHVDGAGLRRTAHGELHRHDRQAQKQQAEDIDEDEAASAVLAAHPREFPYVSAADGAACRQQDKAQPGTQAFSFHLSLSFRFSF